MFREMVLIKRFYKFFLEKWQSRIEIGKQGLTEPRGSLYNLDFKNFCQKGKFALKLSNVRKSHKVRKQ